LLAQSKTTSQPLPRYLRRSVPLARSDNAGHASAEAKAIRVDVKGSEITLSGPLYSWAERQMANNSAWNTPGVHSVIDRMTVVT
jgi:osmotically-inducible protein OsmY